MYEHSTHFKRMNARCRVWKQADPGAASLYSVHMGIPRPHTDGKNVAFFLPVDDWADSGRHRGKISTPAEMSSSPSTRP